MENDSLSEMVKRILQEVKIPLDKVRVDDHQEIDMITRHAVLNIIGLKGNDQRIIILHVHTRESEDELTIIT